MKSEELAISIHDMNFAVQAWGNSNDMPVIALHGWLDNSASFYRLAPLLKNIYLLSLDLAGHGQSSRRHNHGPYNIWEDVSEIFAIADKFGWKKFGLLGHSRGGIIATIAAGTFPERISHLGLIEGILPEPITSEEAPVQLARSIDWLQKPVKKNKLNIYPSIDAAISARERGMFPLSPASAKALTERGIKKFENGYVWSTDPLLLAPSSVKLLPEQMAAFIQRVTAPTKLILGDKGMPKIFPAYTRVMQNFSHIHTEVIGGGHHLHMEEEVYAVADILNTLYV